MDFFLKHPLHYWADTKNYNCIVDLQRFLHFLPHHHELVPVFQRTIF